MRISDLLRVEVTHNPTRTTLKDDLGEFIFATDGEFDLGGIIAELQKLPSWQARLSVYHRMLISEYIRRMTGGG